MSEARREVQTAQKRPLLEEDEVSILERLDQVEAEKTEDWTTDLVTFPIYNVWCNSEDGYGVSGAWSNGYWITDDDEVYRYDFDFEALFASDYKWKNDGEKEASVIYMPRGNLFVRGEDGWRVEFLTEAKTPEPPEQIEMYITEQTEEDISVSFVNNGEMEWTFGDAFAVEVLLDGAWYELPMLRGGWYDIGYVVESGEERENTYPVKAAYGEFYPGTYRIRVEDLTAEFTVE